MGIYFLYFDKKMMDDQIFYLIKDFGFPVVMCVYFMIINNGTIKKNTEAINGLSTIMKLKLK